MRVKLDSRWVERLTGLPESGMGYQRVDLQFTDGRELKDVMVLNAEDVDLPDEFAAVKIVDLVLHSKDDVS
jgi:hypothetical protein